MSVKSLFIKIIIAVFLILGVGIYFKYFFNYEQRNKIKRELETITGQNLVVTVFDMNGKIVKRWTGVQKITSSAGATPYSYFYTKDNKYVQLPNSVWFLAEEE